MASLSKLEQSLQEQQRIAQLLIQKDLALSESNEHLNREVSQLRVLQEINNNIRTIQQRDEALHTIAEGLVLQLHFCVVLILLDRPSFKIGVNFGYRSIAHPEQLGHNTIVRDAYENNNYRTIHSNKSSTADEQELINQLRVTSVCIFPLQVRGKKYGVFICGTDDPYQSLTNEDQEFLEIVANSISVTLESLETDERQRYIDSLKSEFVSITSHQLRTPLSIVKWILKMSLDGDFTDPGELQEFLRKAYQSNERMILLVNDLLDVSRIEEGRLDFQFADFDIVRLLQEELDQFNILAKKKHISLQHNLASMQTMMITGDQKQLRLVFHNLLDNAIKYTSDHGTVTLYLERKSGGETHIQVRDTGIGISDTEQKSLFIKFFRAERAKLIQTEGSGLGLFIALKIVEKHKGKITVQSVPNKGSTFTCILPA